MTYKVTLLSGAYKDIKDIYSYISLNDSTDRADNLTEHIWKKIFSLKRFPRRGHAVNELKDLRTKGFYEINCSFYRIIYKIYDKTVIIYCVLDGRRNMQELLGMRLLR